MKEYSETIPAQYEEGKAVFMGMEVLVDERVLIPRPETELLVEIVAGLCRLRKWQAPLILDMGTGSGAITLGLIKLIDDCGIVAADISDDALAVARENLKKFRVEKRVSLKKTDMFSGFDDTYNGVFNCVVSNPPYVSAKDYEKLDAWVRAEPRTALYAGEEGLDHLNTLAGESQRVLADGGLLALEVGYDQAGKVKRRLREHGFIDIRGFKDLNGYERVITGWKHG